MILLFFYLLSPFKSWLKNYFDLSSKCVTNMSGSQEKDLNDINAFSKNPFQLCRIRGEKNWRHLEKHQCCLYAICNNVCKYYWFPNTLKFALHYGLIHYVLITYDAWRLLICVASVLYYGRQLAVRTRGCWRLVSRPTAFSSSRCRRR